MVAAPEILGYEDGYVLWHGGVVDGPHGLTLTVEVLDETGGRRMTGDRWQSSNLNRGPIELSVVAAGGVIRPCETIEARSPDYYRLICMFGKYGRSVGARITPDGLQLDFTIHPLGLHVTRVIT